MMHMIFNLTLLLVIFSIAGPSNANQSLAYDWLGAQQQADGRIHTKPALAKPSQSTLEAISALDQASVDQASIETLYNRSLAIEFVTSNLSLNSESLARAILLGVETSVDNQPLIALLLTHQNNDGGFGAFEHLDSDLVSTAYALIALAKQSLNDEVAKQAINYLAAKQEANGSWMLDHERQTVEITAIVSQALWHYRKQWTLDEALNGSLNYLQSQVDTNGLWQGIEASALALTTLFNIVIDRSPYQAALANFIALQNPNGSFAEDVYLTALAANLLSIAAKPAPDTTLLSGKIIDGDTSQPLANITILLQGPENRSTSTQSAGQFSEEGLAVGNYELSISKNGYSTLSTQLRLNAGDRRDLGTLALLKSSAASTTATIIGRMTQASDGAPLAGVTITVTQATTSVITDAQGQYQLNDIVPGAVRIQASLPGYATRILDTDLAAGESFYFSAQLEAITQVEAQINGTISAQATGLPLEGVRVSVVGSNRSIETITDVTGKYQISELAPGEVTLSVALAGYQSLNGTATLTRNSQLQFSPALVAINDTQPVLTNAAISGSAVDITSGLLLTDVIIEVNLSGTTQSTLSDTSGAFTLNKLAAGQAFISISKPNYQTQTLNLNLLESTQLNLGELALLPEGFNQVASVKAIILDSRTNQPLEGVNIEAQLASGSLVVRSGTDGSFQILDIIDAEAELLFTLEGYTSVTLNLFITANEILDLYQIRMRPVDIVSLIPDLSLSNISTGGIITDLNTLSIQGNLTFNLHNNGNAEVALATQALAYYDQNQDGLFDSAADTMLGQIQLPELAVDASAAITVPMQGVLPFRDAPIQVWVDSAQALVEGNETNNQMSTTDRCKASRCNDAPVDSQAFEPVVKWHWNDKKVLTIPIVGPLIDTNQDGAINDLDDPVIVFASHAGFVDRSSATLRAVNGRTGKLIWSANGVVTEGSTHPAMGDIDQDGIPEVIAYRRSGGIAALNNQGQVLWKTEVPTRLPICCHYGAIGIADIDADGAAEILTRSHVFNSDGTIKWVDTGATNASYEHLYTGMPVDLNLDGIQEVLFGYRAISSEGALLWQANTGPIYYTAVGNFDLDEYPEIIFAGNRRVVLGDHEGNILWSVGIPGARFGGAPTIADMDGDGLPEVGIAGQSSYVVFNEDGSILWQAPISDGSSATGSTVFDFDGDGLAEVVYSDTNRLRVYDGRNGNVIFDAANGSATATEYPVVADIDGDNHAELLLTSDTGATAGLRAFEDINDAWVNTRRIWNQYHYHIDNVNDDGSIPANPASSWLTHNTFRLNAFPECGQEENTEQGKADLTLSQLTLTEENGLFTLAARIGNAGSAASEADLLVTFTQDQTSLGEVALPSLATGTYTDVRLENISVLTDGSTLSATANSANLSSECQGTNNQMSLVVQGELGEIRLQTDANLYGPNNPVNLVTQITNPGSLLGSYQVLVSILDANGALITELESQEVIELTAQSSQAVSYAWNTQIFVSGNYQAKATLFGENDKMLSMDTVSFMISEINTPDEMPDFTVRAGVDRAVYTNLDEVQLEALVENTTLIEFIGQPNLSLTLLDATGAEILSETQALTSFVPNQIVELFKQVTLNNSAVGTYQWQVVLKDGDTLLAQAARSFEVVTDVQAFILPSVEVEQPQITAGGTQTCTLSALNVDTQALDVSFNLQVVNVETQSLQYSETLAFNLPAGDVETASVSFSTGGFGAGNYACLILLSNTDPDSQSTSTNKTSFANFEVQVSPVNLLADLNLSGPGRALVLLDDLITDNVDVPPVTGEDKADPFGPDQPTLLTQRRFIESLLTQQGWSYNFVDHAEDFDRELDTGHYNVIALFNEKIKLSEVTQQQIVNAVYSGMGLLRAGGHDQRNGRIETALGIKASGKTPKINSLFIDEPLLLPEPTSLSLIGNTKIRKVRLEGAQSLAFFQTKKGEKPAITQYEHGKGQTLYMPFDLLLQAASAGPNSDFAQLLIAALNSVNPTPLAETSRIVPWTLTLQNQGSALNGQAQLVIPEGTEIIDPGQAARDNNQLLWPFSLSLNEQQAFSFWLKLPTIPGAVILNGQVGAYNSEGELQMTIPLQASLNVTLNTSEAPPTPIEGDCYRIQSSQTEAYLFSTDEDAIAPSASKEEASIYCLETLNNRYKIYDAATQNYWKRKTGGANDLILLNGTEETATQFDRHPCFFGDETNRYGLSDPADGGTPHVKLLDDESGLIANNWNQCDSHQEQTGLGFVFEAVNNEVLE